MLAPGALVLPPPSLVTSGSPLRPVPSIPSSTGTSRYLRVFSNSFPLPLFYSKTEGVIWPPCLASPSRGAFFLRECLVFPYSCLCAFDRLAKHQSISKCCHAFIGPKAQPAFVASSMLVTSSFERTGKCDACDRHRRNSNMRRPHAWPSGGYKSAHQHARTL